MDYTFEPPKDVEKVIKVEVKSKFVGAEDIKEVKKDEHGTHVKTVESPASLAERLQKQTAPTATIIRPPSNKIEVIEPEFEIHENPRFMKEIRRVEMKHKDHSGIFIAKRCLREYFYSEVLGMVLPENVNVYLP